MDPEDIINAVHPQPAPPEPADIINGMHVEQQVQPTDDLRQQAFQKSLEEARYFRQQGGRQELAPQEYRYDITGRHPVPRQAVNQQQVKETVSRLPVAGALSGLGQAADLYSAKKRFEAGAETDADRRLVADAVAEQEDLSKRGFKEKAADLATHLPAVAVEWIGTGGIGALGRKAGQEAATAVASRLGAKAAQAAASRVGQAAAGAVGEGLIRTAARPDLFTTGMLQGAAPVVQPTQDGFTVAPGKSLPKAALDSARAEAIQNIVFSAGNPFAAREGANFLSRWGRGLASGVLSAEGAAELKHWGANEPEGSALHRFAMADTAEERHKALEDFGAQVTAFGGMEGFINARGQGQQRAAELSKQGLSEKAVRRQVQEDFQPLFDRMAEISKSNEGWMKQVLPGERGRIAEGVENELGPEVRRMQQQAPPEAPPAAAEAPPGPQEPTKAPESPVEEKAPPGPSQTPPVREGWMTDLDWQKAQGKAPEPAKVAEPAPAETPAQPQTPQQPPQATSPKELLDRLEAGGHGLDKRDAEVLKDRLLWATSFDEIGRKLGVSGARVKQIEQDALKTLGHSGTVDELHLQGRAGQAIADIEEGKNIRVQDLHEAGELAHIARINQLADVDERIDRLLKKKMKLRMKGTLTPEQETEINAEYKRLVELAKAGTSEAWEAPREQTVAPGGQESTPGSVSRGNADNPDRAEERAAPGAESRTAGQPESATPEAAAGQPGTGNVTAGSPRRGDRVDPIEGLTREMAQDSEGAVSLDSLRRAGERIAHVFNYFRDRIGELGGRTAPRTRRLSSPAANAVAQLESAADFGRGASAYFKDRVLGQDAPEDFRNLVGTTILEERFRTAKAQLNDRASQHDQAALSLDQQAIAATKPKDKAKLTKQAQAERDAAKEDRDSAQKIKTFVGGKDSVFQVEADFQAARNMPEVNDARDRYEDEYVPHKEEMFRHAEGIEDTDPIHSITQMERSPISAYRLGENQPTPPTSVPMEMSRDPLRNPRLNKLGRARQAKLQSDRYETDLGKIIELDQARDATTAAKANLYRVLQEEGLGAWAPKGQKVEFDGRQGRLLEDVNPPKGTQANAAGEMNFIVHPDIHSEVTQALDVNPKAFRVPGVTPFFSLVTAANVLGAGGEITSHLASNLGAFLKPGMRFRDFATSAWEWARPKPETMKELLELSRIDARRPQHQGLEGYDPASMPRIEAMRQAWESKWNPLQLGGRVLHAFDDVMRLTANKAYDRMAGQGRGWIDKHFPSIYGEGRVNMNDEANRRDFINQLFGQYNKRSQNRIVVLLRESGLNPYATAATTNTVRALKLGTFDPSVTSTTYAGAAQLRAEVAVKMASLFAVGALFNFVRWGRVDGDDNTPVGAWKTGTNSEGKTTYIDPPAIFGVRRAMKTVGVSAMVEGMRPGSGATPASMADKGAKESIGHLAHPILGGPPVQFGWTAATGRNTLGHKIAAEPKPGDTEVGENFVAALKQINPTYFTLTGSERPRHAVGLLDFFKSDSKGASTREAVGKNAPGIAGPFNPVKVSSGKPGRPDLFKEIVVPKNR